MKQQPYLHYQTVETEINKKGTTLWQSLQAQTPGIFNTKYWQGLLIDKVIQDPAFKVDLFRFVDLLPALKNNAQIVEAIHSYLLKPNRTFPPILALSFKLFDHRLSAEPAAKALQNNITQMAENFITAADSHSALPHLQKQYKQGYAFTADILGEKVTSESEAEAYYQRYNQLINDLNTTVFQPPTGSILGHDQNGPIPTANISIKISALDSDIDPIDLEGAIDRLYQRLLPLLIRAKQHHIFVNLDLEQWAYHFITYRLFAKLATSPPLIDWPHFGIVIQAYLRHAEEDFDFLLALAKKRGTPLTIRLVKGAYWDYEVIHARQQGLKPPVWLQKNKTDACYERLSYRLLTARPHLSPAFGSHNIRSLLVATEQAKQVAVPPEGFEIQMLTGMAEPIRALFKTQGYRVRLYTPIGKLLPGMAYLVRRLLENTSNSGFLRQGFYDEKEIETLLASPHDVVVPHLSAKAPQALFNNTPFLDFTAPTVIASFREAIDKVKQQLPISVPIGSQGKFIHKTNPRTTFSPNDLSQPVAQTSQADEETTAKALAMSQAVWPEWRDTLLKQRAEKLMALADQLEADRYTLAALQTIEVAKPWREADGDVGEAIDFCRYYADRALIELRPEQQGQDIAGEENWLSYEGRGPTVVIAPWNFPLAILCGMTAAALVAGNSVLIKPSGAATATAFRFFQAIESLGLPAGVVQFLAGPGHTIGNQLVKDPRIAQIAFTGSKEVGLNIIAQAAITQPGQPQVKRVVCEMGGKNANIIDQDADLDLAVTEVMKGAFGYAGQKCSACSRVIVLKQVYPLFKKRLINSITSLRLSPATQPGCRLGPVVEQSAVDRLMTVIHDAKQDPRVTLLCQGEVPAELNGHYVSPVLFEIKDPNHPLFQVELFGPILTLIQAPNFEQALKLANQSEFALTGALFSRHLGHVSQAKQAFRVGNLYINRASTGALVNRQPFGGFAMSGLGNKAGGPGYVQLFSDIRCTSENTLRQGFSPDLQL